MGSGSRLHLVRGGPPRPASYGGQAVVEGVMIRGPETMAVACRRPDGGIAVSSERLAGAGVLRRLPLLRGPIVLWETLALGMRAFVFSSSVQMGHEGPVAVPRPLAATMLAALALAGAAFFAGPVFLTVWMEGPLGESPLVVLVEGLLRLAALLAYLYVIGRSAQVRSVFAYHGAEHKAINALEAGDPLEVPAVQRHSVAHARCGTSFLLTLVVVAIPAFLALGTPDVWPRAASRIVLVPVLAAVAYEVIRLSAVFGRHRLVRAVTRPMLALQALTTREPDDGQVEVALRALHTAVAAPSDATGGPVERSAGGYSPASSMLR